MHGDCWHVCCCWLRAPAWADDLSGEAARHQVAFHAGWVARDVEQWSGWRPKWGWSMWLPAGRRFGLELRIAQDVKHIDAMPFLPHDTNDPWSEPQDTRINTRCRDRTNRGRNVVGPLCRHRPIAMDAKPICIGRRDYSGSAVGVRSAQAAGTMGALVAGLDVRLKSRGDLKGRPYKRKIGWKRTWVVGALP